MKNIEPTHASSHPPSQWPVGLYRAHLQSMQWFCHVHGLRDHKMVRPLTGAAFRDMRPPSAARGRERHARMFRRRGRNSAARAARKMVC